MPHTLSQRTLTLSPSRYPLGQGPWDIFVSTKWGTHRIFVIHGSGFLLILVCGNQKIPPLRSPPLGPVLRNCPPLFSGVRFSFVRSYFPYQVVFFSQTPFERVRFFVSRAPFGFSPPVDALMILFPSTFVDPSPLHVDAVCLRGVTFYFPTLLWTFVNFFRPSSSPHTSFPTNLFASAPNPFDRAPPPVCLKNQSSFGPDLVSPSPQVNPGTPHQCRSHILTLLLDLYDPN